MLVLLSPFSPYSGEGGGGGVAVRFGAVQPGGGFCPISAHSISRGGGGGVLSPFGPFNQCVMGGGGGACMLTFIIKVPFSPKGGGGGMSPLPHPGDAHDWVYILCRPCLLGGCSAGALQALPMVLM